MNDQKENKNKANEERKGIRGMEPLSTRSNGKARACVHLRIDEARQCNGSPTPRLSLPHGRRRTAAGRRGGEDGGGR
jgi:hypothetical protein